MKKRKKRLVRRFGLVFMSLLAAGVGIFVGGAIMVGIIHIYSSN